MKEAWRDSWYAQVDLQTLEKCLSSRFGGKEFFISPFFLDSEQLQSSETDINDTTSSSALSPGSKTGHMNLKATPDPKVWPYRYKISISILLNAFPLVVAVGTSILSPATKELTREFDSKSELTVLTTSLFMLVSGLSMKDNEV